MLWRRAAGGRLEEQDQETLRCNIQRTVDTVSFGIADTLRVSLDYLTMDNQ